MTSLAAILLLAAPAAAVHKPAPPVVDETIDWDNLELHHQIDYDDTQCQGALQMNINYKYEDDKYVKTKDTIEFYHVCDTPVNVFSPNNNRLLHYHFVSTKVEGAEEVEELTTPPHFEAKLVKEESQFQKLKSYAESSIQIEEVRTNLKSRISALPPLKAEYEKFIKEKVKTVGKPLKTKK